MTPHGSMVEKFIEKLSETANPMQLGRARKSLCIWMKNSDGIGELRCKVIYDWVISGVVVKDDRICFPDGCYVDIKGVTKTGISFAKFVKGELT